MVILVIDFHLNQTVGNGQCIGTGQCAETNIVIFDVCFKSKLTILN